MLNNIHPLFYLLKKAKILSYLNILILILFYFYLLIHMDILSFLIVNIFLCLLINNRYSIYLNKNQIFIENLQIIIRINFLI